MKQPPNAAKAEAALLGALMRDPETFERVELSAEHFYLAAHKTIFAVIAALAEDSKPFDLVAVSEELERDGRIEDVGGLAYLGELFNGAFSAPNAGHYARTIRRTFMERKLVSVCMAVAEEVGQGGDVVELLDSAQQRISDIAVGEGGGASHIKTVLGKVVERIDKAFQNGGKLPGLPTGFADLDRVTSGLSPGELVILAARPSMGKTALAGNVIEHIALEERKPVLFFSVEMPEDKIGERMLSSVGRLDPHRVRTGKLEDDEWPKLTSAVNALAEAPVFVDDSGIMTPALMRARARRLHREHGIALVVVDYLQLMRVPGIKAENRYAEVSEISRSLKALAKDLDIPVLALAQVNRAVENRADKRPLMSDLRDSGTIEQDADQVWLLYRDEVYHEDSPHKGTAELIVGKNRNGPIGTLRLTARLDLMRFDNYVGEEPREPKKPKYTYGT